MNFLKSSVFLIVPFLLCQSLFSSDSIHYEYWDINNLENIDGHSVTVLGDPVVEETEIGPAVRFDGVLDQLMVDFNPVGDAKEFTVEIVFKPDACYPENTEPRFCHMQDPNDPEEKRVMIELRIDAANKVYMDGFMKTDLESLALIDESLVHSTEVWQHVAITYGDSTQTTYFNGIKELSGQLRYTDKIINTTGKTSLGARMNNRSYYAGLMKYLKVSHAVLDPEQFIFIHEEPPSSTMKPVVSGKKAEMGIFPNPVDKELILDLGNIPDRNPVEVNVYNSSGEVCYRNESEFKPDELIRINTEDYHVGLYLVSLKSENWIESGRVLVIH